jgi:trigger factor
MDLALPMVYSDAVKQEKIVPVASPKVDLKQFGEEKDFIFSAEVDVLPEIKLGDYKKIKIKHKAEPIDAKDEDIDKVIKRLLHQQAKYIVTSDGAKEGDRMEITFTGKVKGVQMDKYTSKHYPFILGEKVLMPEFEKKITGAKKGNKLNFKLKIQNDEVDFAVEVNEVWHVELPKADDAFAKNFGSKDTKELWKRIGDSIKMEKEQKERQIVEEKVFDELLKKVTIDVPESMIEHEVGHRIDHLKQQMGPAFDKFLESQKKDIAQLQKEIRPVAERAVRISLAISELAKTTGNFNSKKLSKDMKANEDYQREAMKKTVDELVNWAIR